MSIPNIVHPWSSPSAAAVSELEPTATPDACAAVAEALFAAGFITSAIAFSDTSGDEATAQRAVIWRDVAAADRVLAERISDGRGVVIPSVALRADGSPRFQIHPVDNAAAATAIAREHGPHGIDAELRLFLDEALRSGDRYVDASPDQGFAALSAASGTASASVIALCADQAQARAITASAEASAVAGRLTAHADGTLDQLSFAPTKPDASTILHLGGAAVVAPLLRSVRAALERREIGVVAWRCGRSDEAGLDAEHLQVAAAVLGVFGFQHFALADGAHGTELVPAEVMASNEMIFSIEPGFLARFAA